MSAEHEKDPAAALKRPRGGEGGLDGLGGSAVQLGSPDKKKRKAVAQGSCFPPPSEYAPPPNPSSDHLVAANPFDDNYNTVCYKPLPPAGNPYFASPGYPGFGGYNSFRMAPHLLPRMASQYGAPYPLRSQPHPFPQSPVGMVFSRPQAMNFGPHENVGFGNQPPFNASVNQNLPMPGQHFRPNPGENFGHMPSQTMTQMPHHEMPLPFGPGSNPSFNSSQVEPNPPYGPPPHNYGTNKPLQRPVANKHGPTPPQHPPEEPGSAGNADLKPVARHAPAEPDGLPPKPPDALNSSQANGTQNKPLLPRSATEGGSPEKAGQLPLHSGQHGHPSSDPVYPCGICTHEVNDDQDAILCEASCQKWFHRICTGMTESAYGLLTAEASAVWGCDTCMADKDVQLMRTRETGGPPVPSAEV